jgi:hypothetical protein
MIRTGSFTTQQLPLSHQDSFYNPNGPVVAFSAAANTMDMFAGTFQHFSASDSAWHAFNAVFNGASSVANVDGTETVLSGSPGTTGLANVNGFGIGVNMIAAKFAEGGIWPVGFTATQRTNMCHNQYAYWGTATSC